LVCSPQKETIIGLRNKESTFLQGKIFSEAEDLRRYNFLSLFFSFRREEERTLKQQEKV